MAASPVHSSHLTLVVVLHLVFSIVAIAFLSYKVYFPDNELSTKVFHLEKELFSIREEISLAGTSYGVATVPSPTSTAAKFYRNERYRRTVRKDPKSGSKDEIRRAECVKNLLNNLQVCTNSLLMDSIQVPTTADAFPVVASLPPIFLRERSDDRKCVCCSQATTSVTPHVVCLFSPEHYYTGSKK